MTKKLKYKEVQRQNGWVVVAQYQPGGMWMRPEDTQTSRHELLDGAIDAVEKHKKAGASDIEILKMFVHLEMK